MQDSYASLLGDEFDDGVVIPRSSALRWIKLFRHIPSSEYCVKRHKVYLLREARTFGILPSRAARAIVPCRRFSMAQIAVGVKYVSFLPEGCPFAREVLLVTEQCKGQDASVTIPNFIPPRCLDSYSLFDLFRTYAWLV